MSLRYKGARLSATPPTTTGGTTVGANAAPGIWTLDQQMKAQGQSAWPGVGNYIEDVFSTWLYTGNGSTQTITNNIDLSTKGGMVWIKSRSGTYSTGYNVVNDTVRGAQKDLYTNTTGAQSTNAQGLTAFTSSGFSVGNSTDVNGGSTNIVSWTFRKQAKFFDVVTYTGDGTNDRPINHNLGSVPGCIIVKRTDSVSAWSVYHRSLPAGTYNRNLYLNTTASYDTNVGIWGTSDPTSTQFRVGTAGNLVNVSGATYVAYLFAHDAGGFGAAGTDNVISCGSYTGDGAATKNITINYEPQWVLVKNASAATNWLVIDQMRGMPTGTDNSALLNPNLSNAESSNNRVNTLSATGFLVQGPAAETNASGNTYIYIAIRRGPMKTPTSGTSVFTPVAWTATAASATVTGFNFPVDLTWHGQRAGVYGASNVTSWDRLRGAKAELYTGLTDAESTRNGVTGFDYMSAVQVSNPTAVGEVNYASGNTEIFWGFRRAPGFFDVVCYTGTGANRTVSHNLGVAPELMIIKQRNSARNWAVYNATLGNTKNLLLNTTDAENTLGSVLWNNTTPTSSVFTIGTSVAVNESASTYVAYLFATVTGVSKVGSYTGTGALQTVNCGFTSGARFVLIKRTDTAGDWWVYDSARGITSGNDPYLFLNSTAAEVTGTNYVDTDSTGFKVTAAAPAGLNAVGGNYIFLAIA